VKLLYRRSECKYPRVFIFWTRLKWAVTYTFLPLYRSGKHPQNPLYSGVDIHKSRSGRGGRKGSWDFGLQGCDTMQCFMWLRTYQRNILHPSPRLNWKVVPCRESNPCHSIITDTMEAVLSSETDICSAVQELTSFNWTRNSLPCSLQATPGPYPCASLHSHILFLSL
jgi:hypothetical protein